MVLDYSVRAVYVITIKPTIAKSLLEKQNNINRYVRASTVDQYARDMLAGRWLYTGEPFLFDWNGENINGQHRLHAVVKSGVTLEDQVVIVGLDPKVRTVIDTHSRRSVRDAFAHAGHKDMVGEGGTVGGNTAAGMWGRMKYGLRQIKGVDTRQELLAFAETYPEGGLFAIEVFGRLPRVAKIATSPVMAAVARAYYHYDDIRLPQLERFVEVLVTGKSVNELEANIHNLRLFLTGFREDGSAAKNTQRNSNAQHEIYGKTGRAIQAFMRNESIGRLYCPQSDPFPLPSRPEAVAVAGGVSGVGGHLVAGGQGAAAMAQRLPITVSH